jgi:hypothetical protein
LTFDLKTRKDVQLTSRVGMPLDSLFKPRFCPNGKKAHISWEFCPWSGKKLKE